MDASGNDEASKRRWLRHAVAVLVMVCGTAMVLGLLLMMNAYTDAPEKSDDRRSVAFDVAPKPKPPKKKQQQKPKTRKTQVRNTAPPPPIPNLASSLSSVSLGMPEMEVGQVDDVSNKLLGDMKTSVMTEDAVDAKPRPIRRAAAPYPPRARAKGITGHVTLNLLVDERGNVERIKVLDAEPAGTFEESAKEAVRNWTFEPATYEGEPVKVWAKQTVRFDLT